ncbi:MAG: 2-hydroxyacid dehydrogenase [Lachnospiraceae bacterium]|nr:2-hydroxyacid dehydrogenase [Lachnospiraceae bacterium]
MRIAFFDTKPYDKIWFDRYCTDSMEIKYFEGKLHPDSAILARNYDVVVAFVNDNINEKTLSILVENGVKLLAMRCAGYNNIDLAYAKGKIPIVRVPGYSPYAVAEHAMAMLLCLNRKIHRAFNRTREYNFSINGFTGWDLHGKTAGVIGTGKIGQIFIEICKGFGMEVLAYDPYPAEGMDIHYVELEELFSRSDVISLHCPLTKETDRIINEESIRKMKRGVTIINTSRGALIESEALLKALREEYVRAAGLDVYEEETDLFYEDRSNTIIKDEVLSLLVSMPNVLLTSHQAFLTEEALENIASVTIGNIRSFFEKHELENEV